MHANRAVHAVVEHKHDNVRAILNSGRHLLPVHQETAIAGRGNHDALGMQNFAAIAAGTP